MRHGLLRLAAIASPGGAASADDLQPAGVIAAPAITPSRLLASPQLGARGWFVMVDHPFVGARPLPGSSARTSPDSFSWDRPRALVGEHHGEVLAELGYTADDHAALDGRAVIADGYPVVASADAGGAVR